MAGDQAMGARSGSMPSASAWIGAVVFMLMMTGAAVAIIAVAFGLLAAFRVAYDTPLEHPSGRSVWDRRSPDRPALTLARADGMGSA